MKILHIIPSLKIGGAQKLVIDICKQLNQFKEIEYFLIIFENLIEFDTREIKVKFIKTKYIPRILSKSIKNTIEIELFLKKFRADIIHTHLWESEITLKAIKYPKAIRISHIHSNIPQLRIGNIFKKNTYTNLIEKYYFLNRNDSYFISVSKENNRYLKRVLPLKFHKRIILIPNGISLEGYHLKRKYNKLNELNLITVGSFTKNKNQQLALKIVKKIRELKINCSITFLGEGPELSRCKAYAQNLGIIKNVFFHGNVLNTYDFLCKSDLYVHTSRNEAFGLSILEAMANGLPVVTLNGKGNSHFIRNEFNGFCLESEDEERFVNVIIKIYTDLNFYSKISKNAIETARNFSIEAVTEKIVKFYYKLNKL